MSPSTTIPSLSSRREFLWNCGGGLAGLALSDLLTLEGFATEDAPRADLNGGLHHRAKARRVIQLFMCGGVSHMDTFDYRPELNRRHGQRVGGHGARPQDGALMRTPFTFAKYGQSGRWVSEVFPHQARHVDDLAFLMAMHNDDISHDRAHYLMTTGFRVPGFPCLGSWISFGLGRLSRTCRVLLFFSIRSACPTTMKRTFRPASFRRNIAGRLFAPHERTPIADLSPRSDIALSLPKETAMVSPCCNASIKRTKPAILPIRAWKPASLPTRWPPGCR